MYPVYDLQKGILGAACIASDCRLEQRQDEDLDTAVPVIVRCEHHCNWSKVNIVLEAGAGVQRPEGGYVCGEKKGVKKYN